VALGHLALPHPYTHVLVHYGEIALKKTNRPFFEQALVNNLQRRISERVRVLHGRLLIELAPDSDLDRVHRVLSAAFGVANFAAAVRTEPEMSVITARAVELAGASTADSFRIATRRADKRFPFSSTEVNERVGAAVLSVSRMRVDLSRPQLTIHIEITGRGVYLYSDLRSGPGGMPVGVSGRVLALVSGGIDSPVAALYAAKRGCECVLVHFHNYTFYQDYVKRKLIRLAEAISVYSLPCRLIIVPFVEVQRQIVQHVDADYRMIAYRRAMLRISERLAEREGAKAFVTGDNIAQVASQTLDNLALINSVAKRPVLAPLIGFDKSEIMQAARRLGTYEISVEPYQDCCSAFVARHPVTAGKPEALEDMESDIDFGPLIGKSLTDSETIWCRSELDPPASSPRA
jgi:thiamine biosynthesis protein ThiI